MKNSKQGTIVGKMQGPKEEVDKMLVVRFKIFAINFTNFGLFLTGLLGCQQKVRRDVKLKNVIYEIRVL